MKPEKEEWRKIAEKMYGGVLPPDLESRLEEIDYRIGCAKPNGRLRSSQVIASVLVDWLRKHREQGDRQ